MQKVDKRIFMMERISVRKVDGFMELAAASEHEQQGGEEEDGGSMHGIRDPKIPSFMSSI